MKLKVLRRRGAGKGLPTLRRVGEADGEGCTYESTYGIYDEAEHYTHFGVGQRYRIPSLVPSAVLNFWYVVFVFGIVAGWTAALFRWLPWILVGSVSAVVGFALHVRAAQQDKPLHRLGIWWGGGSKIVLGDLLCRESTPLSVAAIRRQAEAYEEEGYIASERARHIVEGSQGLR